MERKGMYGRWCYCPEDGVHPNYLRRAGVPPGFCGQCLVCGGPGHTRHFPGPLPYTGAWCDAHYSVITERMMVAEDPGQPYGLRDADRKYFHVPGRRRFLLWQSGSLLLEFRLEWLARYIVMAPSGRVLVRQERWVHPLSSWVLPLELMRRPDWSEARQEDFERAWVRCAGSSDTR